MRLKHALLVVVAGFLVLPNLSWSQGRARPKIGAMISNDPDKFFDMLSSGKDVVVLSELSPQQQQMAQTIASRFGLTLGERITRGQYKDMLNGVSNSKSAGGAATRTRGGAAGSGDAATNAGGKLLSGAGAGRPANPKADMASNGAAKRRVDDAFRDLDKNSDGVLSIDEIPTEWHADRDAFDSNHDGVIDLNEFKNAAKSLRILGGNLDRNGKDQKSDEDPDSTQPSDSLKAKADEAKATVYRADKLPKGLPEWFARLDRQGDQDGQIGLWEARSDKEVFDNFAKIDLNGDGLLTPEEVLRWRAMVKARDVALRARSGVNSGG